MTRRHGPGVEWLARRSGEDPDLLAASPGRVLRALRGVVADPPAEVELAELHDRIEHSRTPGEAFLDRLAQLLLDEADRLRRP